LKKCQKREYISQIVHSSWHPSLNFYYIHRIGKLFENGGVVVR
jgi:hypothetical protein